MALNYRKIEEMQLLNKVSDRGMGRILSMSGSGYGNMMKRKTMTVEVLEKIAEFFDVPVEHFFTEEGKNTVTNVHGDYAQIAIDGGRNRGHELKAVDTGAQVKLAETTTKILLLEERIHALEKENALKDEIISILKQSK